MYTFDESGWPVVRMEAAGDTGLADVEEYVRRWEGWLSGSEKLGVILIYGDEEQGKVEKSARKLSNRWHKENRERIGELCVGVAGVVKSSKLLALYKPIASRIMKKRMGCPGAVFDDEREAEAWLRERLAEAAAPREVQDRASRPHPGHGQQRS
jgi:hypothetical protein